MVTMALSASVSKLQEYAWPRFDLLLYVIKANAPFELDQPIDFLSQH